MEEVDYNGDHDFMTEDGTTFIRFNGTIKKGEKFKHNNEEYIATECYECYLVDDTPTHRWFIEPINKD